MTLVPNTSQSAMRLYFSSQYLSSGHEFDTTRKAGWIVDSLADRPIPGVEIVEPTPLSLDELIVVHDANYVQAVQTGEPTYLAESQGFSWDPGLFPAVCASNGGITAAALEVLKHGVSGSLSSGLHHARKDRGSGYCTFNGLIFAARKALESGAKAVLILDLDAHCGGGTASLIEGLASIRQVDISVSRFDNYDGVTNSVLEMVDKAEKYLPAIQRHLDQIMLKPPDLVIYNAGIDPYEGCSTGGLVGITFEMLREREQMVFSTFRKQGVPIAFALAGGYVGQNLPLDRLVNLHRLTIEAAATVAAMPWEEADPS
jgi:acetoin utilization deacetylase AcuC-like enzyme